MTSEAPPASIDELVQQRVELLLADSEFRARNRIGGFGAPERERLEWVEGRLSTLLSDGSLSGAGESGFWLNGASIINSTITADKITVNTLEAITTNTGDLNVTGTVTVAPTYPAVGARIEINSTDGFRLYSAAATTAIRFNMDGSGEIGPTSGNKISWTTTPTLSIPAAVITSLTIANVGTGTFGGTYQTGAGATRIDISTSGIVMYASGVETLRMNATTGAITMTGSFTMQSATSGARVKIDNAGGIEGFNAASTSMFRFNAATGAGYVGGTGAGSGGISWDSSGTVAIGGTQFSGGKIQAGSLSVSQLSAISANLGTITAGTISAGTVNAGTLTTGNLAFSSNGSLNGTGTYNGTLGSINLANLTVTGTITLGSGGKIIDADGSVWDQTGISLVSAGAYADVIQWKNGAASIGSIHSNGTTFTVESNTAKSLSLIGANAFQLRNGSGSVALTSSANSLAVTASTSITMDIGTADSVWNSSGDLTLFRYLFPGNQATHRLEYTATGFPSSGAGIRLFNSSGWAGVGPSGRLVGSRGIYPNNQNTYRLQYTATGMPGSAAGVRLTNGTNYIGLDSSGRTVASGNIFPQGQTTAYIGAVGTNLQFATGTAGSAGALVGYLVINVGGTNRHMPYYATA